MRRLLLLCVLIFSVQPLAAQTESWSVWLFDVEAGQVVEVDEAGAVLHDIILPVPAAYVEFTYAPQVAVSPDGSRIAYAVTGLTADDEQVSAFLIYDTALSRLLSTYETPAYAVVSSLTFSSVAWNDSGSVLAVAYATGTDIESQSWRMLVLNATDGRIVSELNDESSYFASQSDLLAPFLLPVLQFYNDATLGFNLIPYQTMSFASELLTYEWDVVTGRIVQTNRAPRITGETLSTTGETITPITDDRINYDDTYAPYTNAIHVYRPEVGARAPFFATRTYDVLSAQFVQNGEQVVAYAEDLLSMDRTHLLISRAGVQQSLPAINAIGNRLIGTPDGFAYVIENQTPFLLHVNTRDNLAPAPIWGAPQASRFVPVWATVIPQSVDDYAAWVQLAPQIFPAQVIISNAAAGVDPEAVPTTPGIGGGSGVITVDSLAIISTTGGDRLNMRDTAGLGGTIIARVDNGTRVVVTDGPIFEDGFTWWEIRLSTGQSGWVVERAEGVQTLVPGN